MWILLRGLTSPLQVTVAPSQRGILPPSVSRVRCPSGTVLSTASGIAERSRWIENTAHPAIFIRVTGFPRSATDHDKLSMFVNVGFSCFFLSRPFVPHRHDGNKTNQLVHLTRSGRTNKSRVGQNEKKGTNA